MLKGDRATPSLILFSRSKGDETVKIVYADANARITPNRGFDGRTKGSVAMHLSYGGVFDYYSTANLLLSLRVDFENWFRIDIVTTMRLVSSFFGTQCVILSYTLYCHNDPYM